MTKNKKKIKYLSQYRRLLIEYNHVFYIYKELQNKLDNPGPGAQKLLLIATTENCNSNPIELEYFRLISLEELIYDIQKKLVLIEKIINKLDDPIQRTVLRLRYLDGLPWEKICVQINYEWAWTHRIHNNALSNITI